MRIHWTATVALCLGMAGCVGPTQPGSFVHGTVRYTDGNPVERALVLIEGGDQTFTNAAGTYRLQLPASGTEIKVLARDGYAPGRYYAVTHSGSVDVPRQTGIVADVVLDHETPI
jgi:carboxypeptidase family protein